MNLTSEKSGLFLPFCFIPSSTIKDRRQRSVMILWFLMLLRKSTCLWFEVIYLPLYTISFSTSLSYLLITRPALLPNLKVELWSCACIMYKYPFIFTLHHMLWEKLLCLVQIMADLFNFLLRSVRLWVS